MVGSLIAQDSSQDETKPMTFNIRGGIDILGDIQFNYLLTDTDDDLNMGYTLGADLVFFKWKYLNLGVGYEIQLERELDELGGNIGFNTFFGLSHYFLKVLKILILVILH